MNIFNLSSFLSSIKQKLGKAKQKDAKAFTLIELILVVAIIGILTAVVLVSIQGPQASARDSRRQSDLSQIGKGLQAYYLTHNTYPQSEEISLENDEENAEFAQAMEQGGYFSVLPGDPSYTEGGEYTYKYISTTSNSYTLCAKAESKEGYYCVSPEFSGVSQEDSVPMFAGWGETGGETSDGWIKVAGGGYTIKAGVNYMLATYNNGRKIARDSDGSLHCVWADKRGDYYQIYYAKSIDGGESWTETALTSGNYSQYEPSIAIDSNNNIHIVWAGFVTSRSQIRYIKYTTSWQPIENLTSGNYSQYEPSIAIDGNNYIHIAWAGTYSGSPTYSEIFYRKYTNSWQSAERLTSGGYWQLYPSIAIDSNNYIHIAWEGRHSESLSTFQIRYIKYTTSWQPIENLTSGTYYQGKPSITIDGNNNIHIVWNGTYSGQPSYYQIRYIKYTTSWQPIENLTSESLDGQWNPSISIDRNNNIHIVWRGTYSGSPTYNQIRYIKYTTSWQPIENLTSGNYDQTNPSFIWQNDSNNIPSTGYAFIWTAGEDNYTVKYYASDDLK